MWARKGAHHQAGLFCNKHGIVRIHTFPTPFPMSPKRKTPKAFVSSTYVDLKDHRAHVIRALRRMGVHVDPMEDWTSDTNEPTKFCLERIEDCDLCILLVAFRRGHVPDGGDSSITQLECEQAKKLGIHVLPFLLDEDAEWRRRFDELDKDVKIREWREQLRNRHGVELFDRDPTTLNVEPAVTRWLQANFENEVREHHDSRLNDYLASVRQMHGWVQFLGLPQLKDNRDVRIDRLFVQPRLTTRELSPDLDQEQWPYTQPLLEFVVQEQALIILGDPGSGKSTLVNWIAWQLASETPNAWQSHLGDCTPIPLILRDLHVQRNITWDGLLESFLSQPIGQHVSKDYLLSLLEEGRAFVLLDGLDEIGSVAVRRDLCDAVQAAMQKYDKSRWILTSRIVGYSQVPFHMINDNEVGDPESIIQEGRRRIADVRYVAPFNDQQIEKFARNWYQEREENPDRIESSSASFLEAIHRDVATTRLARIPNLLTIMALIFRVRARLPNGKALLYNEIAQAYLETIDDFRKLRETNDTFAEKRRWLALIGYRMQQQRAETDLDGHTKEVLAEGAQLREWVLEGMTASGKRVEEGDAQRFIDHIKRRSGLMIERSQGQFAFAHLSFQEYFCACHLVDTIISPEWSWKNSASQALREDLQRYANESVWTETLVFLFELIHAEEPSWEDELRKAVFGSKWEVVRKYERDRQRAVSLLCRLVTNPHVGFREPDHTTAVKFCLDWDFNTPCAKYLTLTLTGRTSLDVGSF